MNAAKQTNLPPFASERPQNHARNGIRAEAPPWPAGSRPRVDGKFLTVNGRRFRIKGVTYGTFAPNSRGELLPEPEAVRRDMRQMRVVGVNTVRTYTVPPRWFLDMAREHRLMVVAGLFWEGRQCLFDDEAALRWVEDDVAAQMEAIAGHPALLMVCLGNEIPPLIARWHGKRKIEGAIRRLRDRVKAIDPEVLVTYASYPPTEFLDLSFLDVIGFNVYLEREPEFRAYLARLQMLAGDRPLFLAELGMDSRRGGLQRQAEVLDWQLRAVWEKGLAGAAVYAWTDDWAVAGTPVDDWDFGLVDRQREPKPALEAVRWNYRLSRYDLYERDRCEWPRVSVVCCAYNAAASLGETLASLAALNYPDYEVIVVDDGSRDATAAVASRYPFRLIRVSNGGLSRARNLGIDAATGEIVAFIDADAAADPDWLYFIVAQMEEQGAAACGGPNLSPPGDPETAQRVARSPGNPVHVLLDNERAEHVPGCNMAVRKSALAAIGGFDPVHTAAGDDVDVCWKLLERGERIAFSAAAIVWHHRRPSQQAYLRQQQGYGFAEALLEARYPERFGMAGGALWRGRVYDGPQPGRSPLAFRERVHHGAQAGGLFQSVYTLAAPWWLTLAATPGFILANAALAVTAGWLRAWKLPFWELPAALFLLGLAVTAACCLEAGFRLCAHDELPVGARWRRSLGVAWLHLLQPWARAFGRLKGNWRRRGGPAWSKCAEGRLWAGWDRRREWLDELERLLREAGMEVSQDDEWGRCDLRIQSFPGYTAFLESVVEHQSQVRFRARVRATLPLRLARGGLLALIVGTAAVLPLVPLAVPLAAVALRLEDEERRFTATIAALARKAGVPLGMVPLERNERERIADERLSLEALPWCVRLPPLRGAAGRGEEG